MEIFFTTGGSAESSLQTAYRHIHQVLIRDNKVWTTQTWLGEPELNPPSLEQSQQFEHYQEVLRRIKDADLIVAEITQESRHLGYEMSIALSQRKPVIALFQGQQEPALIRHIDPELCWQRLMVVEYGPATLITRLTLALEDAKRFVTQRFTVLLPTHLVNYLDETAQALQLSKASYVRQLIELDRARRDGVDPENVLDP